MLKLGSAWCWSHLVLSFAGFTVWIVMGGCTIMIWRQINLAFILLDSWSCSKYAVEYLTQSLKQLAEVVNYSFHLRGEKIESYKCRKTQADAKHCFLGVWLCLLLLFIIIILKSVPDFMWYPRGFWAVFPGGSHPPHQPRVILIDMTSAVESITCGHCMLTHY